MKPFFIFVFFLLFISCKTKKKIDEQYAFIIDVEEFGAKGNDKFDDTEAIQTALDFLEKKSYGKLRFKPQTYILSKSLKIEGDNIEIDLQNATIDATKVAQEDQKTHYAFEFSGQKKTEIHHFQNIKQTDLLFVNDRLSKESNINFIQIRNEELCQKEREYYYRTEFLEVKNKVENKFLLKNNPIFNYNQDKNIQLIVYDFISNCSIKNGTIRCQQLGFSGAVLFEKSAYCKVENLVVENTTYTGIQFNNSLYSIVDNCTIERAKYKDNGLDYGVLFSYAQYGKCVNSTFKGGRTGGDLSLAHYIEFRNNELYNCGINPHAGTHNLLVKNKLHNGEIYMRCSDSVIDSNEIWIDHQRHGAITLSELFDGKNIEITNNKIYFAKNTFFEKGQRRDSGTGIYSDEHCLKNIAIKNNEIYNAGRGIYFFKANNEPCNEGLVILNNKIIDCAEFGICTDRYAKQEIIANKIKGRTESCIGIAMWASGGKFDEINIKENDIESVGQGISVSEYYEKVSVKANKMLNVKKKYNGSIEKELKN